MALTPMMKQYLEVKETCKDAILFFRLGDFYEMFFEDAEVASKELELVLTGRDCGLENRAPMCGIPFHSAENYISRLVTKGFKVAICEQVEDPAFAKGIVKRDIVKILTPGTYMDASFLDESKNNFIMCIFKEDSSNVGGLSFADISTGEFYSTSGILKCGNILDEIAKFSPSEIIYNETLEDNLLNEIKERYNISLTKYSNEYYNEEALESVKIQFKNYDSNRYDMEQLRSISSLIAYLKYTQKNSLSHIDTLETYNIVDYLVIDTNSRMNLELTETLRDKSKKGSLLSVLDKTSTAMGARRLRKWIEEPLVDKILIEERQNSIEDLVNNLFVHEELKETLKDIYDIERLVGKISSKSVNAKELMSLKNSIGKIPSVKEVIKPLTSSFYSNIYNNLDDLNDIYELLNKALDDNPSISVKEGNIIKTGYNEEVDSLREAKSSGKQWIASLEQEEKELTGIRSLKIGFNKVFGYYLEVTKSNLSLVPTERYIRKQTLSNGERYITPELKEVEEKVLGAEEKLITLEYELFAKLRDTIETHIERMKSVAKVISEIDSLSSLATVAVENNYVKPTINEEGIIDIKDGRHPVVEKLLSKNTFVENDTYLNTEEDQLLLITGPNMAGKSTYMRQVALLTLMAQMGSFIPVSSANIAICDRIFTRIGASDDLASGKSTFMVEMWEVSNILKNATSKSLILLDEVGRGTSTYDGLSIAWAVIEFLCSDNGIKAKTLFATHYHELIKLEQQIKGIKNYSVAVKEINNEIVFLRKIICGGTDESYGIEVAKLAGIPTEVTDRAKEILSMLESENSSSASDNKITSVQSVNKVVVDNSKEVELLQATIKELKEKINNLESLNKEVAMDMSTSKKTKCKKQENPMQMTFEDVEGKNLLKDIKELDILSMNPMEGFNKLYELVNKAKNL
ncbi:DNA mismatch repair protein MutS [Clostridium collagenovorans DSM 3089]|uniref:DNA mismatch repair protein MutS n=1 Tax=Clostridium collagenovorans DSM 3089 TaxID=1121306 RepID=A0A1M5TQ19_9CLOT|nr:DNA mismatch repair protein MutS [Clostridium collagenovorans]SHH52799.1 DNA mismatch repair protein MutS [Clostridium collagenovorans DSM 3089]